MRKRFAHRAVLPAAVMLAVSMAAPVHAQTVTAVEAKAIASDAYLYAYPMLYN